MTSLSLGCWWALAIVTVLNLWWSRGNEKRARELDAAERSLGIRSRWLERRARQIDVRHLRCSAFARLLDMRAQRLGVNPDGGKCRAEA